MEHRPTVEPTDYELLKSPDTLTAQPPPRRSARMWIAVAALVAIVAAGDLFLRDRSVPQDGRVDEQQAAPPVAETARPLGDATEPVEVPPLDQSDDVVRRLVGALSSHPALATWLATDGLVRNAAVVVENVTQGRTPASHLRVLRPSATFQVVTRGDSLVIDPSSYQRYDHIAAAAASVDAAGASRVYAALKPRLQEAYADLGHPDVPFDTAVERAIVLLLQTPVVHDPIRVRPHGGVGYEFTDPALESLAPAQKQLLRMGARNVQAIQSALRSLAQALGVPASRLPAPHA
jgi:hypothetical protein